MGYAELFSEDFTSPHVFSTRREAEMSNRIKQQKARQPDQYEKDLHSTAPAGQNYMHTGGDPEKKYPRTAHELKHVHQRLQEIPDDLLRQIPVLPEGARLQEGSTYIDLNDPARVEFTSAGDMEAGPHNYFVPKSKVNYQLWNRLRGVNEPERTGQRETP
jgi:hypothetical protein